MSHLLKLRQLNILWNDPTSGENKKIEKDKKGCDAKASLSNFSGPKGYVELNLKGPHHPLEYTLHSAHKMGSGRTVRVETESVNSVLLDEQPEDIVDQWFLAWHVGMNPTGTRLSNRLID